MSLSTFQIVPASPVVTWQISPFVVQCAWGYLGENPATVILRARTLKSLMPYQTDASTPNWICVSELRGEYTRLYLHGWLSRPLVWCHKSRSRKPPGHQNWHQQSCCLWCHHRSPQHRPLVEQRLHEQQESRSQLRRGNAYCTVATKGRTVGWRSQWTQRELQFCHISPEEKKMGITRLTSVQSSAPWTGALRSCWTGELLPLLVSASA